MEHYSQEFVCTADPTRIPGNKPRELYRSTSLLNHHAAQTSSVLTVIGDGVTVCESPGYWYNC